MGSRGPLIRGILTSGWRHQARGDSSIGSDKSGLQSALLHFDQSRHEDTEAPYPRRAAESRADRQHGLVTNELSDPTKQ